MKKVNLGLDLGKLEFDPIGPCPKCGHRLPSPFSDLSNKGIVIKHMEICFDLYEQQQKGVLASEQRKSMKVIDALSEVKGNSVELEDDWFEHLYKCFTAAKFQGGRKIISKILDELERAKAVESKKKDDEKEGSSQ